MRLFKRLFQRLFCRTRTLAELLDRQRSRMGRLAASSGIVMTPASTRDEERMKKLIIIALSAALCAVALDLGFVAFRTLIDSSCDDALAEYRVEHMETLRELKRLEKFVGGWGLPKP